MQADHRAWLYNGIFQVCGQAIQITAVKDGKTLGLSTQARSSSHAKIDSESSRGHLRPPSAVLPREAQRSERPGRYLLERYMKIVYGYVCFSDLEYEEALGWYYQPNRANHLQHEEALG